MPDKEPRAWMRRWAFDNEPEYKVRNQRTGRMILAPKFMFHEVTRHRILDDDVPLYDREEEVTHAILGSG